MPALRGRARIIASTSKSRPRSTSCSTWRSRASARARSPPCSTRSSCRRRRWRVMLLLGILAGFGLSLGRFGTVLLVARRLRGVDRLLHPVRGRPARADAGKADRRHPGGDGYRARRHARRRRGAQPAPGRRLSPAALSPRHAARRLPPARQAAGRHGGRAPSSRATGRTSAPAPSESGAEDGRRRRCPSWTTPSSGCCRQFADRQADLDPAARARLAATTGRRGCRPPGPAGARRSWPTCSTLHARELARREGAPVGRRGGRGGHPLRRAEAATGGTRSSGWRSARPGAASTASPPDELPDFAARYREVAADLARARTYRADAGDAGAARAAGRGRTQRALPRGARHLAPALDRARAGVPGGHHRGARLRARRLPRLLRCRPRRASP